MSVRDDNRLDDAGLRPPLITGASETSSSRSLVLSVVTVAALLMLFVCAQHLGAIEHLSQHEVELRTQIRLYPLRSVITGAVIYFAMSLVPGSGGKSIVAGWLFGFASGLSVVMVGIVSGAVVTFQLSRSVLREVVESRLSRFIGVINSALERDGAFYLLSLRMAPVSYTLINYGCGATRLRFRTFLWTTLVGLLPTSALLVYFGTQLPTLSEIAGKGLWSVLEPELLFGMFALAALPLITRKLARELLKSHRDFVGRPRGLCRPGTPEESSSERCTFNELDSRDTASSSI